jgi:hypothetical protein
VMEYLAESRWTSTVPVVSAIIITVVGIGLTIKAGLGVLKT